MVRIDYDVYDIHTFFYYGSDCSMTFMYLVHECQMRIVSQHNQVQGRICSRAIPQPEDRLLELANESRSNFLSFFVNLFYIVIRSKYWYHNFDLKWGLDNSKARGGTSTIQEPATKYNIILPGNYYGSLVANWETLFLPFCLQLSQNDRRCRIDRSRIGFGGERTTGGGSY